MRTPSIEFNDGTLQVDGATSLIFTGVELYNIYLEMRAFYNTRYIVQHRLPDGTMTTTAMLAKDAIFRIRELLIEDATLLEVDE